MHKHPPSGLRFPPRVWGVVLCWVVSFWVLSTRQALADDTVLPDDQSGIFNIVIENDLFVGSDSDYTSGVRFAWLSSEDNVPDLARSIARLLPLAGTGSKRISVAVGQSMFAPEDLSRTDVVAGDQPYAGWLYGSVGMVSDTGKTLDNVMLTLGVIGPWAFAEETQKFVHNITGSPQPQGWAHQLHNELGLVLTYERKWRNLRDLSVLGLSIDATPHVGINLGNINTDASVGATFRMGYNLPADYGPPRIRPSLPGSDFFIPMDGFGGYVFTTIGGRAVARNIFLDGNTFADSPSVNKKHLIGSLQVGVVGSYKNTRISYTQVFVTKEYDTQNHSSAFGTVTLSHRF